MCGICGARLSESGEQDLPIPTSLSLEPATTVGQLAERKFVTIMFVDMVGSLAAIKNADPEEAHALFSSGYSLMKDAIHAYSGTVITTTGDGVLAVFGAPVAQADHAARSCHAALVLLERVAEARKSQPMLDVRIGLYSGEVAVGTSVNDFSIDYEATGATVHIAARLQHAAPRGCAVMGRSTKDLISGEFKARSLGQIHIKGLDEEMEIFVLEGVGAGEPTQWQASEEPFVGRTGELDCLRSALKSAMGGQGQVVLITGEAGIGKSRLIKQFIAASPGGFQTATGDIGRYRSGAPFQSFRTLLFDLIDHLGAEPGQRRAAVSRFVDNVAAGDPDIRSALLELFEIGEPSSRWRSFDPRIRHQLINQAILLGLARESTREPLVLIVEDMHQMDSCSVELLGKTIEAVEHQRVLVLITCRPEIQLEWGLAKNFTVLRLAGLSYAETDMLIKLVIGDEITASLSEQIKRWAYGNPLFLRECIRMVDRAAADALSVLDRTGREQIHPPALIRAIIAERIDLLDFQTKDVFLAASVLGQRFMADMLARILAKPVIEVEKQLQTLVGCDFVHRDLDTRDDAYIFSHPLFQEVCYATLLKSRRTRLHATAYAEITATLPAGAMPPHEALAHHAFRGAKWQDAVIHCRAAGEKAAQRSAPREALIHLRNALTALARLDPSNVSAADEIDLRLELRASLVQLLQLAEAEELLRAAGEIAARIDDQNRLAVIVGLMAMHDYLQRGPSGAERLALRSISLAELSDNNDAFVSASICLAQSYYALGDVVKTIAVIEKTIPKISLEGFAPAGLLVQPMLMCWYWLAISKAELGLFDEAERLADKMLVGKSARTVFDSMYAKTALGFVLMTKGESARALRVTAEALEIADTHDLPYLTPVLASQMGLLLAQNGESVEALRYGRRAVRTAYAIGVFAGRSRWCARLAEIELMAGEIDESRQNTAAAISVAEEAKELGYLCSALRIRARLAVSADNDPVAARVDVIRAMTIAQTLGLEPTFAKCLIDLAHLDQMDGNDASARDKLANARRRFRDCGMGSWEQRAANALAKISSDSPISEALCGKGAQ